ncbi:hypothetical protein C5167_034237, partial [Papaver somniferum]
MEIREQGISQTGTTQKVREALLLKTWKFENIKSGKILVIYFPNLFLEKLEIMLFAAGILGGTTSSQTKTLL